MLLRTVLAVAALVACQIPDKQRGGGDEGGETDDTETTSEGTSPDARTSTPVDASVDAPTPSVDAGPPPEGECQGNGNGMQCELPPPACLDLFFLLKYTGADCVDGECVFSRQLEFCVFGCEAGACR